MQRIKIGIIDEEKEYVMNLTTYLQRYGKGKWDVSAFTNEKALHSHLEKRTLDVLAGTDRRCLTRLVKGQENEFVCLWLADKLTDSVQRNEDMYSVYRFQSAEEIGRCLEGIVRQECTKTRMESPIVAVYSPVGRCGKTTLALEIVKNGNYGKWLYLGMEDYSSFQRDKEYVADELLYYWKEQREEKLLALVEKEANIIASGSSFFDARQIEEEDIKWLKKWLQKSNYRGVVLDIGTGILQDFHVFKQFDYLLVPYVEDERALIKKGNFDALFEVYDMEDYRERMHFINMNNRSEITSVIQKIFGGDIV